MPKTTQPAVTDLGLDPELGMGWFAEGLAPLPRPTPGRDRELGRPWGGVWAGHGGHAVKPGISEWHRHVAETLFLF